MRVAPVVLIVLLLAGCDSPTAPTPPPPRPPPSPPAPVTPLPGFSDPTFNATFWSQLIYNAFAKPRDLSGRRSRVMPTTSPNVYIRTTNVERADLAYMRRTIPGIVSAVTGHPYVGRVEHGPDDRQARGWITIRVVTADEVPEAWESVSCGYAYVGADPGSVWIAPWESPGCDEAYPARMLAHELGHALGLFHVPDDDAVMKQYAWTVAFSDAERHHAQLAYARGRGAPYGRRPHGRAIWPRSRSHHGPADRSARLMKPV